MKKILMITSIAVLTVFAAISCSKKATEPEPHLKKYAGKYSGKPDNDTDIISATIKDDGSVTITDNTDSMIMIIIKDGDLTKESATKFYFKDVVDAEGVDKFSGSIEIIDNNNFSITLTSSTDGTTKIDFKKE